MDWLGGELRWRGECLAAALPAVMCCQYITNETLLIDSVGCGAAGSLCETALHRERVYGGITETRPIGGAGPMVGTQVGDSMSEYSGTGTVGSEPQPGVADIDAIAQEVERTSAPMQILASAVETVVVGQSAMVEGLLIGLLCNGHVLLEGVPGLAKTLTVSSLASAIHAQFKRIQFTPDLLPADLIGTLIYNPKEGTFAPRKGPVFANIVLADEINRAPAKVQSALLEAMQERQVTIGDETYPLPEPFLVLATQNPIEQEGTYPLPEAQVDRFMLKLKITYPSREEERAVLDRMASSAPATAVEAVVGTDEIIGARRAADRIYIDSRVRDYIVDVVHATRKPDGGRDAHPTSSGEAHRPKELDRLIDFGASPRATLALTLGARAKAFLAGRGYVTPQDVKGVALDVLRHRVMVSYEAEAEGLTSDDVVRMVLDHVPVP